MISFAMIRFSKILNELGRQDMLLWGDLILGREAEMVEPCLGWIDFWFQQIRKASLVRLFKDVCLGLFFIIPPFCWIVMGLGQTLLLSILN